MGMLKHLNKKATGCKHAFPSSSNPCAGGEHMNDHQPWLMIKWVACCCMMHKSAFQVSCQLILPAITKIVLISGCSVSSSKAKESSQETTALHRHQQPQQRSQTTSAQVQNWHGRDRIRSSHDPIDLPGGHELGGESEAVVGAGVGDCSTPHDQIRPAMSDVQHVQRNHWPGCGVMPTSQAQAMHLSFKMSDTACIGMLQSVGHTVVGEVVDGALAGHDGLHHIKSGQQRINHVASSIRQHVRKHIFWHGLCSGVVPRTTGSSPCCMQAT